MADKSSREIERELEHKRAELSGTIDEALNRMTLEGVWTYAGKYLRDNRSEYGHSMGSVIKEKPLAVGLVAIGMAWIMFGPSTPARRSAQERDFRRGDRPEDVATRTRLEAGDFDDTRAQGPTGPDARPDAWAAPTRTPSPATPASSASRGTTPGGLGGTTSPARSTPTASGGATSSSASSTPTTSGATTSSASSTPTTPGGTSSRSTESPSGSSDTRGAAGEPKPAAPAVVPSSTPASTGGTGTSSSTGKSGAGSTGTSDTSSDGTTSDPKSSKT